MITPTTSNVAQLAMIAAASLTISCSPDSSRSNAAADVTSASSDASRTAPVTVFTGGTIYTGLEETPTAEAVAVTKGKISAVGTRDLIENAASGPITLIDLEGATLYPGFTDSHAHLIHIGFRELTLNLEGVGSVEELVSIVTANAQHTGEDEPVIGAGWIETGWPEGRMPTRDDLDPISQDKLIILRRADGHAMVVNTAALKAAGIDDSTPDPDGGRIERDTHGRATGILVDNAMGLVAKLIGAPSADDKREAFAKASDVYAAYGWTGLHNMSVDPSNVSMMENLSAEGKIDIRVYNALERTGIKMLQTSGAQISENNRIITRAIKLYSDGALGSRGALLSAPYTDSPDTIGLSLLDEEDANTLFEYAMSANIQIMTHAIGDLGNTHIIDWYENAFAKNPEATDLRWRIEHSQILDANDIARFAELGIIPSMQPSHAIGDLYFAPDRLGSERLNGAYAWRALIDAGSIIAGGSDAPVERGDPLIEFYAAVARRGLDGTQTPDWHPEQAVTRAEALKMFTLWPAIASFQEDSLGTIEPGKRADFTVFSKDIMTVPEDEIRSAKPVMTVVDGEIIFQAE